MGIEEVYAVFGNRYEHNPKSFGTDSCRCCGWIVSWDSEVCVEIKPDGTRVMKEKRIAEREPCACSGYFCERCKSCIDHCTCELRIHPVAGQY